MAVASRDDATVIPKTSQFSPLARTAKWGKTFSLKADPIECDQAESLEATMTYQGNQALACQNGKARYLIPKNMRIDLQLACGMASFLKVYCIQSRYKCLCMYIHHRQPENILPRMQNRSGFMWCFFGDLLKSPVMLSFLIVHHSNLTKARFICIL